jgi:lysophospholipase L1-like esterase
METQLPRTWKFTILILVNLIIIIVLLYGFEHYLKLNDPFLTLPFDTGYYARHKIYYSSLEIPEDGVYTWGHRVINNRFGFRERELQIPKPAGVCRIMVLGDSLTWGAGLALEERYTYLMEMYLNKTFSNRQFEVLSFAPPGAPTVTERDILHDFRDIVAPDLIVVGFVLNDPQQRGADYRVEKEEFDKKYGPLLASIQQGLVKVGLPQVAKTTQKAIDNFVVKAGIIPSFEVGRQRAYEESSTEWREFKQALQDIKAMSDEMGLPTPIFAVLNQGIYVDHPTSYRDQAETLPPSLRWYHQAEQSAAEIGFRTHNYEAELIAQLTPAEIPINALDGHPSAKVNLIYAQKLFDAIASDVRSGELCTSSSFQELPSLIDVPLSTRRLMSVKLGDSIRFLGYVAAGTNIEHDQTIHLTFGWQAVKNIDTSYTIFIHILDGDGRQWGGKDSLPCRSNCPTNHWSQGRWMAPPDSSVILQSSSGVRTWMKTGESHPLFFDDHKIIVDPQTPPGEYTLVMGMYDVITGERLSACDEITETWLPEAQIVLGKITIP